MEINKKILTAAEILYSSGLTAKEALNSPDTKVKKATEFLYSMRLCEDNLSIELIIAMNALYRPGPNEEIPTYIKNGRSGHWEYDTPELEPILSVTNGVIVYQEQVMQIVRDLAGYSWGRSDLVRRAMSKKHQDEIDAERHTFIYGDESLGIPGCIKNGISETAANKIYDKMVAFAKYAFNKSHAAAYSITSYYCAWCKEYYPEEYFCSVMNWTESIEALAETIADAKDFGVEVMPPDVNYSEKNFTVNNHKVVFGLSNVKNVGAEAQEIIRTRKDAAFTDIKDFLIRCKINTGALKALINAGAFDSLGYTREQLDLNLPYMQELVDFATTIYKKTQFIESARKVQTFVDQYLDVDKLKERISAENIHGFLITSKVVPTTESIEKRINTAKEKILDIIEDIEDIDIEDCEINEHERLEKEKEVLGLYLTGHPIDSYLVCTDDIVDTVANDNATSELSGIVENIKVRKDKNGKEWASFELSDKTASIKCVAFSNSYDAVKDLVKNGAAVCLQMVIVIDDFNSTDTDISLQGIVRDAQLLRKRSNAFRYITKNIRTWVEDDYKKLEAYSNIEGSPLQILDETTGLIYNASFTVNDDVLLAGAKKIAS